jgi:hypothetical protein
MQNALWKIKGLETSEIDGYENCVVRIHFSVTNGNRVFTGDHHIIFSGENFITFDTLTEDIVMEWLKTSLGSHGILKVESKIVEIQTQPETDVIVKNESVSVELPWVKG